MRMRDVGSPDHHLESCVGSKRGSCAATPSLHTICCPTSVLRLRRELVPARSCNFLNLKGKVLDSMQTMNPFNPYAVPSGA